MSAIDAVVRDIERRIARVEAVRRAPDCQDPSFWDGQLFAYRQVLALLVGEVSYGAVS